MAIAWMSTTPKIPIPRPRKRGQKIYWRCHPICKDVSFYLRGGVLMCDMCGTTEAAPVTWAYEGRPW